jgi:hypothetical protein
MGTAFARRQETGFRVTKTQCCMGNRGDRKSFDGIYTNRERAMYTLSCDPIKTR